MNETQEKPRIHAFYDQVRSEQIRYATYCGLSINKEENEKHGRKACLECMEYVEYYKHNP